MQPQEEMKYDKSLASAYLHHRSNQGKMSLSEKTVELYRSNRRDWIIDGK